MTYLKYIGKSIIPGIPARDLTKAEAKKHNEKLLLESGLWELADAPTKKTSKVKKDGE